MIFVSKYYNGTTTFKGRKNRIPVKKHRAKIGIEKNREVCKEYIRGIEVIPILNKKKLKRTKTRNKKDYDAIKKFKLQNTASVAC